MEQTFSILSPSIGDALADDMICIGVVSGPVFAIGMQVT